MDALEFSSVSNEVPEKRYIYINAGKNKGGLNPPSGGLLAAGTSEALPRGGGVVPLFSFKVNRHGKAINSPLKKGFPYLF